MNTSKPAEFISTIKLRFYKRALFLSMSIVLFLWVQVIGSGGTAVDEIFVFPVYLVFCAVSLVLFAKYDARYLPVFESLSYTLSFLYFSSHFLSEIYSALSQPELSFKKFLIWLPVMYGLSFIMYSPQKALVLSALFLVSIFIPGVGYGFAKRDAPGFQNDLTLLIQIYASGLIYISFFYIIAALKEKFTEADRWARAATSRSNTDSLTKAYSRVRILEILDSYISPNPTADSTLSIVFIDVDRLKEINDVYGHATGDYVLRKIVEALSPALRGNNTLGRIGGDEFLLLLPNADTPQAQMIAERFQQVVSDTEFDEVGKVTISIGVATKQNNESAQSLLTRADSAMYRQKMSARNVHASRPHVGEAGS